MKEKKVYTGIFTSHAKGFGFVAVEGMEEDFFVPASKTGNAMHGDQVMIQVMPPSRGGKRMEAEILQVVTRAVTHVVGTYQKNKSFGFVIADNTRIARDIFIPKEKSKKAVNGHKVVCKITDYGRPGRSPEGEIVEILGHMSDPGVDIISIVKGFDLPMYFSEKQLNQANRVAKEVSDADMEGRRDLRHIQMVTIDGEDAKDLDDAVSLSFDGEIYTLGVHIADVTNYVQEHSALDKEALKRGTSVYLVDRVIPMLPHVLSNGMCSLNAGEDRLALSCIMKINGAGSVVDYDITESVIHVDERMTYTSVQKIIGDEDKEECAKYEALVPMLVQMKKLSEIIRENRHKRGAIDFDFPECKIVLDGHGKPIAIKPYERNSATKLIEDFMLMANETVASHFFWLDAPFVYRTHENPDPEQIRKLSYLLTNLGLGLHGHKEEIHPKEIQQILSKVEGTESEAFISRLVLRSMKQARYTTDCTGHFGLACQYYCHFTSPIRRYPDLQIHRIIKDQLRGRLGEERVLHYNGILPQVAKASSELERRADEAERETNKLKKVQYMEQHIGEVFEGVVSGVTSWGLYVELPNTIEGMVPIAMLPGDYYIYDEDHYELYGEHTGAVFSLGQTVKVQVRFVDTVAKTIDFDLYDEMYEEESL